MQGSTKIPITDLNSHITCKLCNGYFVDATTIIECLHTFCRSCIVKYLEKNKYCPVCDVQVHKSKPLLNIRPDKTIQDIVYKLVPRLFQNEMQKRREFYDSHPESKPSSLEQCGEASYQYLLNPEETVCLTLSYHGSEDKPRYLRCPAAVTMGHLKKLIRSKYDLSDNHRIDILYNQDCLTTSLTLMDVAYIYLWKRKGPIELTYRIYDCTLKKPKLEPEHTDATKAHNNNNNWKEVQLRISENGEMSITGIQEGALSPSLMEIVNSELKYKNDETATESKSPCKNTAKKELPALKYIGKGNSSTVCTNTSGPSSNSTPSQTTTNQPPPTPKLKIDYKSITLVPAKTSVGVSDSVINQDPKPINVSIATPALTACATLSSATTTTVYSTINSSKCSTKSEEVTTVVAAAAETVEESSHKSVEREKASDDSSCDKKLKRKNVTAADTEPPVKQPKPTILNHSLGLQNLSNNHPLKKHAKLNRNGEHIKQSAETDSVIAAAATLTKTTSSATKNVNAVSTSDVTSSRAVSVNKNFTIVPSPLNRPGTPSALLKLPPVSIKTSIAVSKPSITCYTGVKPPCYMPKQSYNPVINVPKPVTSTNMNLSSQEVFVSSSSSLVKLDSSKSITTSCSQQITVQNTNSKLAIKTKPATPIGYKTLRDPPKSWNSQISKANLTTKSSPEPKYSDLKNVRPAKFFKMRNNMPRYLGNPASGVKPMYQLHTSPEKEKNTDNTNKVEKSEIKKHSIVKIDPKTLRPISEKAPETTSLSNHNTTTNQNLSNQNYSNQSINSPLNNLNLSLQSDLKINTSSVSIFSPLKLQSSPKNERKSPKSPHSPKPKTNSSPTGSKREKVNLNFTPPNPFIPNLTSTTMSPNQFLYPTGPPGFPTYDPRVMAAYHNLWYGQRMPFSTGQMPGLSIDLNQQRKNLEMLSSPTSPKIGALSQPMHNHQISSRATTTTTTTTLNISSMSRTHNMLPSPTASKSSLNSSKKASKEARNEKSLENAVEKLTQNRHRAIGAKNDITVSVPVSKNSQVEKKEVEVSDKGPIDSPKDMSSSGRDDKDEATKVEANSLPAVESSQSLDAKLPSKQASKITTASNTPSVDDTETKSIISEDSHTTGVSDSTETNAKNQRSNAKDNEILSKAIAENVAAENSTKETSSSLKPSTISDAKADEVNKESGSCDKEKDNKSKGSEVQSSEVSAVDKAVQDSLLSVNTTEEKGKSGSNLAASKTNDSNNCSEEKR